MLRGLESSGDIASRAADMRRVPSSAKPGGRFEDKVVLVVWRKLSRTFRRCFKGLRKVSKNPVEVLGGSLCLEVCWRRQEARAQTLRGHREPSTTMTFKNISSHIKALLPQASSQKIRELTFMRMRSESEVRGEAEVQVFSRPAQSSRRHQRLG